MVSFQRSHQAFFFKFYAVAFTIMVVTISDFPAKGNLILENRHIISIEFFRLISCFCASQLVIVILLAMRWLFIEPVCHSFLF